MDNNIPRDQIPVSWLDKIRCPYCSSAPLTIERPAGTPEHFSCPTCELSFRVSKSDSNIYILRDPLGINTGYVGQWVDIKSFALSMRIEPKISQVNQQQTINAKPEKSELQPSLADKDPIFQKYSDVVIKNAADLFELGHGRAQIKETLRKYSGLKDEEADEIFDYISKNKESKVKTNFSIPQWALGCIIFPFLCMVSYAIIVFIQYRTASSFIPGDEPRTISVFELSKLPEDMQDVVPQTVMDIAMPEPVIIPLPVKNEEVAACPNTADEAAALYGGIVDDWEYHALQKTWTLQSIFSEQITIPEGYLGVIPTLDEGFYIKLIPGPVKINNSYLVMIRCP